MAQIDTLKRRTGQEHALLDYLQRLDRHREGRIAIHIRLSKLQQHNRREQYIRLAFSTFDNIVSQQEGQTFPLRNDDIIFIGLADARSCLENAVTRLRYLFSEDAVVQSGDEEEAGFCSWFELDRDYARFVEHCRQMSQESLRRMSDPAATARRKPALDPERLAKLEAMLIGRDLSNLIRNQPICAVTEAGKASVFLHELYVSIGDLEGALMDDVRIAGDPWLFQHLTQCLDKRVLAYLARDWGSERSFSVNLNVSTLLSPEFLKFDHAISSTARGRLVIEIQKIDIFADMGAFIFAREYTRDRGYRLCLDGMTHLTLPFIDRAKLELDLVKLLWSPELAVSENQALLDNLRACVETIGPSRMILAHCDSERAVEVGRSLGIGLFQGRHINKLTTGRPLAEMRTVQAGR